MLFIWIKWAREKSKKIPRIVVTATCSYFQGYYIWSKFGPQSLISENVEKIARILAPENSLPFKILECVLFTGEKQDLCFCGNYCSDKSKEAYVRILFQTFVFSELEKAYWRLQC